MGVIIMAFGIIGVELFQQETQVRLNIGETAALGRYSVRFVSTQDYARADDLIERETTLELYRNGEYLRDLKPHVELYQRTGQPMTIPDMRSTIADDFYVIVVNWEGVTDNSAVFRIYLNPLINWVWAGGLIFVLGTMIAAWPDPVETRIIELSRARRRVSLGAAPSAGD
jgi:cytochrome c-type biogenesis protein CcmF